MRARRVVQTWPIALVKEDKTAGAAALLGTADQRRYDLFRNPKNGWRIYEYPFILELPKEAK